MERLQKFMAEAGVASRRACEKIIKEGRVTVNGEPVTELGVKIDPEKDSVKVDGKLLKREQKVYILLNKPKGYVCTNKDKHADKTVFDLIPYKNLHTVGRLDKDTEGLLLLTNDGKLTQHMAHPSHEIDKTYFVQVKGKVTNEEIDQLKSGVNIDVDGKLTKTSKAKVKLLQRSDRVSTLKITIHEGHKRQIRKMCGVVGHPVLDLKRIREANLTLKDLKVGEFRHLTREERKELEKYF